LQQKPGTEIQLDEALVCPLSQELADIDPGYMIRLFQLNQLVMNFLAG
jgi:hypothetical protein